MAHDLRQGDCLAMLRSLPDNSVDSFVSDVPYGLGKEPDPVALLRDWLAHGFHEVKGAGFMGREWDAFVPQPVIWREVFRVLKPGGHVLAFFGTRTYDWGTLAIRLAGFEIRDQIGWCYGSGMPKGNDISKTLDKRRREDIPAVRVVCRFIRAAMDAVGLKSRDLAPFFGACHPRLIDHWAARDTDSQPALPTLPQYLTLKSILHLGDDMDDEVLRLNARKGEHSDAYKSADIIGEHAGNAHLSEWRANYGGPEVNSDRAIRATVSEEARKWKGWNTAIKPAWEPICVARKPFTGTTADNVLQYGTGAYNVDACRIGEAGGCRNPDGVRSAPGGAVNAYNGGLNGIRSPKADGLGRWPANLVFDEEAATLLDGGEDDGPSRFFYCAKASPADRNRGLPDGEKNEHETVKPVALMRWLVRLVTPRGGKVCDPYMGSGTTGVAAILEGCEFIGCELREPSFHTARLRCEGTRPETSPAEIPNLFSNLPPRGA